MSIECESEDDNSDDTSNLEVLLQKALDVLGDKNQNDQFKTFLKLVAEKKFPLNNMAYLLFLDVVQWYSLNNITQMRYSDDSKLFWRVGLKLFKGKFIRFMGGLKNRYLDSSSSSSPNDSRINFAVPNRNVLDAMAVPVDASEPGILSDMIVKLGEHSDIGTTFKLCVDGNKLNSGLSGYKSGDVNLWGLEGPPTLVERNCRLRDELNCIGSLREKLDGLELRGMCSLDEDTDMSDLLSSIKENLVICYKRMAEIRTIRVGQSIALEKLMSQINGDWRVSRLCFVISSLKSKVCLIDSLAEDFLRVIDKFSLTCSILQQSTKTFVQSDISNLGKQENYRCLNGYQELDNCGTIPNNEILSKVQQKSSTWFVIRKLAALTGSTFYRAIGLDGLKKQQQHYNNVFGDQTSIDENRDLGKLRMMEYGSANEINGIATIVSKIIPVYYPNLTFYEEGCYKIMNTSDDCPVVIVSPDGSLRPSGVSNVSSKPTMGIEVKCPFPGKTYSEPIHYKLPAYYVTQVLCEMHVLNVDKLLYVSYSDASTSALLINYDDSLFLKMMSVASDIYPQGREVYPKRLHPEIKTLRKDLKEFCENNVKKLCEIPSVKAVECYHGRREPELPKDHLEHHQNPSPVSNMNISDLILAAHKTETTVEGSHDVSRIKANEVLVFMISNMDRIHDPEIPHSMPIAYALKSYAMSAQIMRNMLDHILDICFHNGIYIPVISFDGQWCNLAVRDGKGKPLTLLQLQKDVYQEAKSKPKSWLIKTMSAANTVQSKTMDDLAREVDISYALDEYMMISSPVIVGGKLHDNSMFSPSNHISLLIKKTSSKSNSEEQCHDACSEEQTSNNTCGQILSSLPGDIISRLDDAVIAKLQSLENIIETANNGQFNPVGLNSVPGLFQEEQDIPESNENYYNDQKSEDTGIENVPQLACLNDESQSILDNEDFVKMLESLQLDDVKNKWTEITLDVFREKMSSSETMNTSYLRKEIQVCIRSITPKLKANGISCPISSPKNQLIANLNKLSTSTSQHDGYTNNKKKPVVKRLTKLCKSVVSDLPKVVLNAIYAEHLFPQKLSDWRSDNLFRDGIKIEGVVSSINWYSKPEHCPKRFQWLFSLLDPHHLYTNARVKCCSSGILDRNIHKGAWMEVAHGGKTNLNIAHVDDLVDKQSDAFAQITFSEDVETDMLKNGHNNEALFCRLIRRWYQGEDDPGICAIERCKRRLDFREWLLGGVNFNKFPPPGTHVEGIPWIMWEGLLTNIDRRIQLFPMVKGGSYNVRSMGSLEAENFFGEFQDLDPKGSGVIRADDLPCAISAATELLAYRMDSNRPFYMHTSKAKVYPLKPSISSESSVNRTVYLNPSDVDIIKPSYHIFDSPDRAGRKYAKRKDGKIDPYGAPSRGVKGVRTDHHCNHAKVLPHKRLKVVLDD